MKPLGLAFVLLPTIGLGQTWKELGPSPIAGGFTGRVSAVACDPSDPNTVYVGAASGGVWKTIDGGTTWTPISDKVYGSSVGAVAIDPTDPRIVYIGTGEANYANHSLYGIGVLKSTDGGGSWQVMGASTFSGRTISKIVIDPSSPQTVYASVAAAGGFPELTSAKGHPGANGPKGVFKSTDGGVTWNQLTNGLPNEAATDLAMVSGLPGTLFAAIGRPFGSAQNGVYKSNNGGANWTKLGGGLPTTGLGRIAVATAPSDSNRVYALIVNQCTSTGGNGSTMGAYRSSNQGSTWTSIPVGSFQSTYGWFLCAVGVSPTSADTALFAGLDLRRTTNGGTSFSTVTAQHVDNHALAWDSSGRLWLGCDGGVFRSNNNGTSWTNFNTGLGIAQFYPAVSLSPVNANLVLGGLQDNGTVQRNDTTKTWSNHIGGDGGYTTIDQLLPAREFAQFQGAGNIYRSTNSGSSWSASGSGISPSDRNAFFSPVEVDPTNSNRILLATHRIYASTNGGTSWAAISGDVTGGTGAVRAMAIATSDPNIVWVATNDGRISRSTDGGANFTPMMTGIPGWPRVTRELAIDPLNGQAVYLSVSWFGRDQVIRTQDGGTTWTALDGNLPDVPVNCVAIARPGGKHTLFLGTDDGVWRSTNDGRHWYRHGNNFPRCPVIDLKVDAKHNRLVAATLGRGAWDVSLFATGQGQGAIGD